MTHRPHTQWFMVTIALAAFVLVHVPAAQALDYRLEETMVPMPDNVSLKTSTWLPQKDGRYPTILIRTPYGIENKAWIAEYLAPYGYAVVVQSVRGKDGSEGDFFPFAYEKTDGMATLDWVLKQPWCNGDIGLWGISYHGFAAFEIASSGHPSVKTMMCISGWSELEPFMMHEGAFHLMAHLPWFVMFKGSESPPAEAWPQIFQATPIVQFFQGADQAMGQLMSEPYDYSKFQASILHITGWYDYIYVNTLDTYERISTLAPDAGEQRLIVGVWPHNDALRGTTTAGDEDFGEDARWGLEPVKKLSREWFDLKLKGIDVDMGAEPPVKVFVMGDNEWRGYQSWPPAGVENQSWFVDCANRANGSDGSGSLSTKDTEVRETDSFVYDPNDPVPTTGGANVHFFQNNLGVLDQSEVEKRQDVLVYTSEPLEEPVTLIGPIRAHVYAATEGTNTDFTAKLVQVRQDGYVRNIADGIARASYQFGLDSANMLEPSRIYEYEIDMGATALVLEAGSRLRLEISSSNFPKYDRNPNTGEDAMYATEFVPVRQTVYHTKDYPTHVVLPVMGEELKRSER